MKKVETFLKVAEGLNSVGGAVLWTGLGALALAKAYEIYDKTKKIDLTEMLDSFSFGGKNEKGEQQNVNY